MSLKFLEVVDRAQIEKLAERICNGRLCNGKSNIFT